MTVSVEKFKAARKASDLTLDKAAELVDMSKPGYINREAKPSQFRLHELESLYQGLNETGKKILVEAVNDIFLPNELRNTQQRGT